MDDFVGAKPLVVASPGPGAALSTLAETIGAELVTATDEPAGQSITASAELAAWIETQGGHVAIVRPDRYVHAIATDLDEAADALRELCALAGARTELPALARRSSSGLDGGDSWVVE
jgi:hypothetical protein